MATELNKNLLRQSTDEIDGKAIMVTLTSEQEIELKLKGQRSKGETISIKKLYEQLYDINISDKKSKDGPLTITTNKTKKRGDNKMISLYDLRTHNAISTLDISDISKFDQIIKNVMDSM